MPGTAWESARWHCYAASRDYQSGARFRICERHECGHGSIRMHPRQEGPAFAYMGCSGSAAMRLPSGLLSSPSESSAPSAYLYVNAELSALPYWIIAELMCSSSS